MILSVAIPNLVCITNAVLIGYKFQVVCVRWKKALNSIKIEKPFYGSTGWFQSSLAVAMGISGSDSHPLKNGFAWHEQRLQFTVSEPFPSRTTGINLIFGAITPEIPLKLESQMQEDGVIFSDGIESDYLEFNSGTLAAISLAAVKDNRLFEYRF